MNALVENRPEQLLGDKWIKNCETNISQGIEHSPSNLDSSPSKIISPSKNSPSKLLGDKEETSPSKIISPSKNSPSNLLEDKEENSPELIK